MWHGLEVQYEFHQRPCHERGRNMRGEVVVKEELAAHEIKGKVMRSPTEEEKAGATVETRANFCTQGQSRMKKVISREHTRFKRIDATTERELICANDTNEHRQQTARNPPTKNIAGEVDLLAIFIVCPKADAA